MSAATFFRSACAALALSTGVILPAQAGGPLELFNHQPVVYANGGASITLNLDQGPLGSRTNAQATAIVQNAIGLWNAVNTSTMRLTIGAPLSTDYTVANYGNVFQHFSDGLNPVIFDTDGSITDAIFGAGAKSSILGFAGSAYFTSGSQAGKYSEGQAVLNGYLNISDATWITVLAHEIGHLFGLDHSQLDSTQGLATSNYVLMYPIAYRTLQSLHEDDIAAVTALYPTANVGAAYGQLNGTFTTTAGAPILGANMWAREISTGKVYSVVSDYLTQSNGFFRFYLPAGTYTLNAESIASNFTGGSGVGPYSNSSSDISFQSPHPITPVALGGASAQQIVIIAGCLATATFRLDGSGGVTGNCGGSGSPVPTTTLLASSPNPATVGATVTFTATVAGNAPTGSVNFKDAGTTISGCGTAALVGSGNSKTATCSTSGLAAGVHSIVATYGGDTGNQSSSSSALSQTISAASGSANVALASAGAVATASSSFSGSYGPSSANDGDRKGLNWGNGGGWNDATGNAYPDWLQIDFNGTKTISEVDVFSVQDSYLSPSDPTPTMTFTQFGLTDFQVQYWTGSAWADVPGGHITGNNLVWRKLTFAAVATPRIRVLVNAALQSYSRIVELEAWTPSGTSDTVPPSAPTNLSASGITSTGLTLSWNASTDNVGVAGYNVFRNGTQLPGSVVATTFIDTNLMPSTSYTYTVVAFDAAGNNSTPSAPFPVTTASGPINVAAQANGGVATASSSFNASYGPSSTNDGDRKGLNWGNGGGWNDATGNAYPDWLQIDFNGTKTISEVDVFSVQDSYLSPSDPTPTMTFTQFGLTDFQVQYWTGSAWADVPGGHITGNNLVWRKLTFAAVATPRIRVLVNAALQSYSRIVELEAWTPSGTSDTVPPSAPTNLSASGITSTGLTLSWNASTDNVGVAGYNVFRNGTQLPGSVVATTFTDTNLMPSTSYTYTVVAFDAAGNNSTPSAPFPVTTASGPINVAAQANGGVATASSSFNASYGPSSTNDGDRKGLNWGNGGGWNDATGNAYPDWLQIDFNGTKTISEVDVFSVQDSYLSPSDPTPTMTFTQFGLTDFQVQYWTGSAWADVPGGHITGNNLVWRKLTFAAVATPRIRVLVNAALQGYSRIVELEVY